jgi:hypothetical protein
LPDLKIPQFDISSHIDVFSIDALLPDGSPPKAKKPQASSEPHLEYYKAAGLDYPPNLSSFDPAFQQVMWLLKPAQVETAVYGDWPAELPRLPAS